MSERQNGLNTTWEYSTELFDAATAVADLGALRAARREHRRGSGPADLEAADAARRGAPHDPVDLGRRPGRRARRPATVKELFEAQAAQMPDAEALVFEGERLSFRELNERANRLAHRLRRLGVGPGTLVGIHMEKSLELVAAVLAVMKAGGAYVPLDPMYPEDRIEFMLADSSAGSAGDRPAPARRGSP